MTRVLRLPSGQVLAVHPASGPNEQSQWPLEYWHSLTGRTKAVNNIAARYEHVWQKWHQLLWPNQQAPSVLVPAWGAREAKGEGMASRRANLRETLDRRTNL